MPGHTTIGPLWVTIELHDQRNPSMPGPELSICGVEAPQSNGNARGSSGQCRGVLLELDRLGDGWTQDDVTKLAEIWDRWHLNGMTAGSPAQEQWLRDHPGLGSYPATAEALTNAGLNPDPDHDGYRYGTKWLYEELPAEVLDWLRRLPGTVRDHPWGDHDYERPQ